jgi:uncharacterized RDD family membrane protein YckC
VAQRHLSEAPLRVSAELVEAPLASPLRRALALAFDFLLLIVPTVVVASAAALLALRLQDPAAFGALRMMVSGEARQGPAYEDALAAFAPLLVRLDVEGLPPEVALAVERGDRRRAAALLRETNFIFDFTLSGKHAELEPGTLRIHVEHFLPPSLRALASYGVMAIYFGLLTAGRRGQTLGKRLVGIRVARLDGDRLSLLASLERFVGYLHIPGTLGISLFDLWHDANRRMPHDRVAHTVVIRVRPALRERRGEAPAPARPARVDAPAAASAPSADAATTVPATAAPRVDD